MEWIVDDAMQLLKEGYDTQDHEGSVRARGYLLDINQLLGRGNLFSELGSEYVSRLTLIDVMQMVRVIKLRRGILMSKGVLNMPASVVDIISRLM